MDELRQEFNAAVEDIVKSETVAEFEAAMARAEAAADALRERDRASG